MTARFAHAKQNSCVPFKEMDSMRFSLLPAPSNGFVVGFGVALLVLLVLGAALSLLSPQTKCPPTDNSRSNSDSKPTYPGGFGKPVIALELPASDEAIKQILASTDCREFQLKSLLFDSFGFIPLYWALLTCQCLFMIWSRSAPVHRLGWLALTCATLAAAFDYVENYFMWSTVKLTGEPTDAMARSIRLPSLCKWSLIFVTLALLSSFFFRVGGWGLLVGLFYALTFLVGLYGVISVAHRPMIESAAYPLLVAALPLIYLCVFRAGEITKGG
jgi:hypothetical protein